MCVRIRKFVKLLFSSSLLFKIKTKTLNHEFLGILSSFTQASMNRKVPYFKMSFQNLFKQFFKFFKNCLFLLPIRFVYHIILVMLMKQCRWYRWLNILC